MSSPLTSPAISPEASASGQSRKELQNRLNGLGGINGRRLDPETKAKKLREACEGFESIFIQKMWQEMRNAVPKSGLMQGREERYWQDMYDQELAKSMTSAGGIGLADMMYEQLSKNLVSASRSAVNTAHASAFTPSAAPLVREAAQEPGQPVAEQAPARPGAVAAAAKPMPSIYEGEAPQTAASPAGAAAAIAAEAEADPQLAATAGMNMPAASMEADKKQGRQKNKTPRVRERGDSGIQQAYLAGRDAGDKLGSRAIRPSLRSRGERKAEAAPQQSPQQAAPQAAPMPGSPEALRAAMDLARTGAAAQVAASPEKLNAMVAELKSKNNVAPVAPQPAANPVQSVQAEQDAPPSDQPEAVVRKVRYTTNIPQRGKTNKASQPIRMLNADNVGINSRAGQGLAAYHAAQQQSATSAPQVTQTAAAHPGQDAQPAAISTGIAPLTSKSLENSTTNDNASFSIPPLTSTDLRG